jgi:ribonuclease P protein component
LRGHGAFRRVFALGQRVDGKLVRCTARIEGSSGVDLRAGFAVSSRAYGAVQRNRLRRLMREAFVQEESLLLEALAAKGRSLDVVFTFRSGGATEVRRLKLQAVRVDMAGICRQLIKML